MSVRSLVTDTDLAVEWEDGRLTVRLPTIGLFDVITITPNDPAQQQNPEGER